MKFDKEIVQKLEEAFAMGADVSAACYYASISRQTYYNWVEENKELAEDLDKLKEKPVLKAYKTLKDNMHKIEVAQWYLSRKRKDEFSTKEITEHTGELAINRLEKTLRDLNDPDQESNQDDGDSQGDVQG